RRLRAATLRYGQPSLRSKRMNFISRLLEATRDDRESLVAIPIVRSCLAGQVSLSSYIAFLEQAYHHVRHTVALLRACRARMPERLAWMRADLDDYIAEEEGHDRWILQDLSACGVDPVKAAAAGPGFDTEVMVA